MDWPLLQRVSSGLVVESYIHFPSIVPHGLLLHGRQTHVVIAQQVQQNSPPPPANSIFVKSGACRTIITFLEDLWIRLWKKTTSQPRNSWVSTGQQTLPRSLWLSLKTGFPKPKACGC